MQALFSHALSFLLVLFISSSAWAQNPYAQRSAGITPGASCDSSLDTLPRETFVPFTRQGNLMLVKGSINGKSVTMVFDTGAAGCLFSTETLKSLGIKIPANLQSATVGGFGSKQQIKAWIMPADLRLGSIERRQFPVHINDNPLGLPLLGVNFIQGFEYTIDTDASIVRFKLISRDKPAMPSPPQTTPKLNRSKVSPNSLSTLNLTNLTSRSESIASGYSAPDLIAHLTSKPYITVDNSCRYVYTVPFAEYRGAIIVLVDIAGKKCPMILDTGSSLCIFNNVQLKQLGITPRFTGQMRNAKGATGSAKVPLCVFDEAQFGPIKDHLVCLVSDQGVLPRPLLGQDFLSKWQITIDHVHSVIKFIHK
jgi:predicted aspartyl protease